uniref:Uncharacterized protein n=1 Tax=Chenopodium quinoa TaxID=63459 RepID=A0A803LZ89_CHEQI
MKSSMKKHGRVRQLTLSFDTQKDLVCNSKPEVYRGTKDKVPIFAEKERRTFRLEKENGDKECNSRKSLAWDHAFLTSPGFLELEELCLVNSGFKNLEVSSSLGNEDNVKSKVCRERKLSQKLGVGSGGKQKCQSLLKTKVASPSKMVSTQGSIRQQMAVEISEMISRSAVVKAQSTASLLESQEMQDGSITYDINVSQTLNLVGHQNNHQLHSCTKQSPGQDASKQNDTTEAKRSPFSSKTSSLRMPSQKIGFFDMSKGRGTSPPPRTKNTLGFEEKENIFHPEDTVIELKLKKGSSSASQSANGSSPRSDQCSSTSKKSHTKVQRPARQSLFSPTPRTKTSTSIPKVSPLKKSAFF